MPNSQGRGTRASLAAVLGSGWLLLGLAAWLYARTQRVPGWASLPIAAAFLIEFPFYILPGFEAPRAWLAGQKKTLAAWLLTASAIAPWLVYSIATGEARLHAFVSLLAVALAVSLWYIVLPAKPVSDALFLIVIAAIYLSKMFDGVYLSPIPKVQLSVLGHLMLIRTAAIAVLVLRGSVTAEFRFIPNKKEWWTGFRYFAMMLPIISLVYWALGLVRLRPHPNGIGPAVLLAIGTFFGVLWVVALSEEFFFRGLLQQWIDDWTANPTVALVVASLLFGCAHLGFHRIFPNWRWAIVAAILGVFSGLAWRNSRSVQAAMVTHTLIVTLWLVFFQIR